MGKKKKTLKALTKTLRVKTTEARQALQAGLGEAQWVLSRRDQRALADIIEPPPPPSPALIRAAERFIASRSGKQGGLQ